MADQISKSAVRRAGSMIRKYKRGECSPDELEPHIDTLVAYRATFSQPLSAVHSRLLELHAESDIKGEVTRRLKKSSTIFDKLTRESELDLSRMQDIGGCRSVVETRAELREMTEVVTAAWDGRVRDYVAAPRDSGYRAIHVIVKQDGKEIEIQLRTTLMHQWAQTVEAFSVLQGMNYKQDGQHLVQRFLKAMSEVSNAAETNTVPGRQTLARLEKLRPKVSAFINDALHKQAEQENQT